MSTYIRPPWSKAPDWAKYLAQDGDGTWYWYGDRPLASTSGSKVWIRANNQAQQAVVEHDDDAWKGTLEHKP